MTYSHNDKMTSSASVRIRSGSSHNQNNHHHQSYYHSNSIASSTNLSTSPSGSTSSNCSTSSSITSLCASRKSSSSPKNNRCCSSGNYFSNNSNHYQHSLSPVVGSCGRKTKNNSRGAVHVLGSSPPTNLSHYAGSKCFDAPAPTALPKPPQHWTELTSKTSGILSSKRNLLDDFNTHNLKLLLNVQS